MKVIVFILFLILGSCFFQYRYLAPEAGINALSTDYSTHISIEQHLKEGHLFPELEKSEKGLHAVSRYLPVYHGLLGFHLSAWVLETLGVPLPGAFLFLMDISLAICLLFFGSLIFEEMKRERRWEHLLAIVTISTIFISNFARGVEAAFFSQIMSYALVLVSCYLWGKQKFKLSTCFLFFAAVTYPDFLIWILPFLVFSKSIRIHFVLRGAFAVIWITLILVLFSRRNLIGPEGVSLYPLFFLPLILILFWKPLFLERKTYLFLLLSYTIVTFGFLFASQTNFTWSYYALKLTYPAVFFLTYAFTKLHFLNNSRGRLLFAVFIIFFWSFSDISIQSIEGYFTRSKILNNRFYASMLETKKEIDSLGASCKAINTLVIPSAADLYSDASKLRLWAKNSLLLNSDISNGVFKSSSFQKIYGEFVIFERAYTGVGGVSDGNRQLFAALAKLTPNFQDICIVSPASEQSLFNGNPCFVILKEQGGQIYAQCKAKTEL